MELTTAGQFQVLYYGADGQLHANLSRWEGSCTIPAGEEVRFTAVPGYPEQLRANSGGQLMLSCEVPLEVTSAVRQRFPMVTGLKTGEMVPKSPDRPSLILRRAGDMGLWDLAKAAGTTVEAIRRANGLTEDPAPGRMLLIPVP